MSHKFNRNSSSSSWPIAALFPPLTSIFFHTHSPHTPEHKQTHAHLQHTIHAHSWSIGRRRIRAHRHRNKKQKQNAKEQQTTPTTKTKSTGGKYKNSFESVRNFLWSFIVIIFIIYVYDKFFLILYIYNTEFFIIYI